MRGASARFAFVLALVLALAGCVRKSEEKKPTGLPPTLITVTQAVSGTLEVTEPTLGTLEAVMDPKVAAEVAGRVVAMYARSGTAVKKGVVVAEIDGTDARIQVRAEEADVQRVQTLLAQQERVVQRHGELVKRNFISQSVLDDAVAQRNALREQLAAAQARAEAAGRTVGKTRVVSPLDGFVEVQIASVGDYVKVGDPLLQLTSNRKLRAHLPFPEALGARMMAGLPVRITSPQTGARVLKGVVTDIRPGIVEGSRAVDVLVDIDNDGSLRGGGTVNAEVVLATREGIVLVPEQSVVLRPAGRVVYVIAEGKAQQREVRAGAKKDGMIEIIDGLKAGETVALDGAGFLTDGAAVTLSSDAQAQPSPSARR